VIELVVAVPAAVAAAACFGTAGVLQHHATHETRQRRPLEPGLLADLIRLGSFRVSVVLGALGFAFQVVALRYGPLILVQPVLVTGVLFYLLVASAMQHQRPDRELMLASLVALGGLSAFLVVARPSGGADRFTGLAALPLGLALLLVVLACAFAATWIRDELRSLPLAVATAVCYGVTAGLVRSLTSQSLDTSLFGHWELYAAAVVGPAGFLLNQNAYQSGQVGSLALAIITVGDPLVAIGVGITWLGESLQSGPGPVVGQIVALAVLVFGVVLLARRARAVAEHLQEAGVFPEQTVGVTEGSRSGVGIGCR
jgi:drug/metabolite transporter (DMT)-like permease